jgi:hypothetical protein
MKLNLLLTIALSLVAAGLYFGLPEEGSLSPADDTGELAQNEIQNLDILQLRKEYLRLHIEVKQLRIAQERLLDTLQASGKYRSRAASDDSGEPAAGVTVYLETTPPEATQSVAGGRQWTSVNFRDAGQAPDGSRQAVMSIHNTTIPAPAAIPAQKKAGALWR